MWSEQPFKLIMAFLLVSWILEDTFEQQIGIVFSGPWLVGIEAPENLYAWHLGVAEIDSDNWREDAVSSGEAGNAASSG
jgi:hypothetical protein